MLLMKKKSIKEQRLFKIEIFCNITDQNSEKNSILNKCCSSQISGFIDE